MKSVRLGLGALSALALCLAWFTRVGAHEHVIVEGYELTVGWRVEPPLVGQLNGVDLAIHHVEEGAEGEEHSAEEEAAAPVTGAEETLAVQIEYGGQSQEFPLRPVFGEDGAYTADVIPSQEGVYSFHFVGAIEATPVDVSVEVQEVRSSAEAVFPPVTESNMAAEPPIAWIALGAGLLGAVLGAAALLRRSGGKV
jgi:hypothetical protein